MEAQHFFETSVTQRYIPQEGNLQLRHSEDLKDRSYGLVADLLKGGTVNIETRKAFSPGNTHINTDARYITR